MAWCEEEDLNNVLSNITISSGISRSFWINKAADEMNSYFSGIYDLPITIPASIPSGIKDATDNLLKSINEDLSSGWLLLSLDGVHESESLQAFAKDLEKRAVKKLKDIRSGVIILTGVNQDSDPTNDVVKPSKILVSSPDGKSNKKVQINSNATDINSYFNRPIDEVANPLFPIDL